MAAEVVENLKDGYHAEAHAEAEDPARVSHEPDNWNLLVSPAANFNNCSFITLPNLLCLKVLL